MLSELPDGLFSPRWGDDSRGNDPTPKTKTLGGLWMGKTQTGSRLRQVGYKSNLYYLLLCCFNRLLKTAPQSLDSCTKSLSFSPHITFRLLDFFSSLSLSLSSWVKFYWSSLEDGSRIETLFMIGKQNPTTPKPQNCEQAMSVCVTRICIHFICGHI